MEQKLRFGLVLDQVAVLKNAQRKLKYAIFEGNVSMFYGHILGTYHLFIEKLSSKLGYFSKIADNERPSSTKLQIRFGNLTIQLSLYVSISAYIVGCQAST